MTKLLTKESDLSTYADLFGQIKTRIQQGQTRAVMATNTEMIFMYWEIGQMINTRQKSEGWGTGVLPRLAKDLHNELPEVKGFSVRNLKLMTQFYKEYHYLNPISQQPVGQLSKAPKGQLPVAQIPWSHNVILIQKIKDHETRFWYMQQVLEQGMEIYKALQGSRCRRLRGWR